jgi:hypothetical protein
MSSTWLHPAFTIDQAVQVTYSRSIRTSTLILFVSVHGGMLSLLRRHLSMATLLVYVRIPSR